MNNDNDTNNVSQLLKQATLSLQHQIEARLEAEILLAFCIQKTRVFLHTWPEHPVTPAQLVEFRQFVARRRKGEPIAYILGHQEFWSLNLDVNPATLVPRSETELLVEQSLLHIPKDSNFAIVDLGTGSGAIALAIATERPTCTVTATDHCTEALTVAKKNAAKHGITNVRFIQSDWFGALESKVFDIIVTNPPYIAPDDPHLNQGDLPYEPDTALASSDNGLADIKRIIGESRNHLKPGGWILFEHGYNQAQEVAILLKQHAYQSIHTELDYAGHPRVTMAQL